MAAKKSTDKVIDVMSITTGQVSFVIKGTTPLIYNCMSNKVRQGLLFPSASPNKAEKASRLKHDPYKEFIDSAYTDPTPKSPTYLTGLSAWFKKSISNAAVDVPSVSKAEIGRLLWVDGERISIYGVPVMKMDVTRCADMARTPDVRTRLCVPRWACQITIRYVMPLLNEKSISSLLAFAGVSQGVGEWRTGKGSGTFGSFTLTDSSDPEYKEIVKTGGRAPQIKAMDTPAFYDAETEKLYTWFLQELRNRGKTGQAMGEGLEDAA